MRSSQRHWLMAEILVCFVPCASMLVAGVIFLPDALASMFRGGLGSGDAALYTLLMVCGALGVSALVFVISRLFEGRETIEKPGWVLTGVLAGVAPLLFQLVIALSRDPAPIGWIATVVLPLLATGHILFLSRNLFVAGCRRGQ